MPKAADELELPKDFNVLLVLGPSGAGKTTFLRKHFGEPETPDWESCKAVISQFPDPTTGEYGNKGAADEGRDRLSSVGLGSIPTWMRPYDCLSNGEQARSRLARMMKNDAVIDDFTSVVNRHAAWAMSTSISTFIRWKGFRRVVFASSCGDVVPWLQPCHVVVLDGQGGAVLHSNPNLGKATSFKALKPIVDITYIPDKENGKNKVEYEKTWTLKEMQGIKIVKVRSARENAGTELKASVTLDESTERASEAFDYEFTGESVFTSPALPDLPDDFEIGIIVGPSGSGKTTLLKNKFSLPKKIEWKAGVAVESHFEGEEGRERLVAVGLCKACWSKPYDQLSMGEQFRAELARGLHTDGVVDEFTSTVDRHTAKEVSRDVRAYMKRKGLKRLVLATCHEDFIPWLQPNWVFSTQTHELAKLEPIDPPPLPSTPDMSVVDFEIPRVDVTIKRSNKDLWKIFQEYHYLDKSMATSAQLFVAWWRGDPVGCVAVLGFPGPVRQGTAAREHRAVVMPDFQGLGIGTRMSNAVARLQFREGKAYFSRTAHPRFGQHREGSAEWVGTTNNLTFNELKGVYSTSSRITGEFKDSREKQKLRICYSHMFVGTEEDHAIFQSKVAEECWDSFLTTMTKGQKRDQKKGKKDMDQLKEEARKKMKAKAEREGQSGKTEFSKGGINGPNKLEGLVAVGVLKAGQEVLELKVNNKTVKGDFVVDKDNKGKYVFAGKSYGDALSFTTAMIASISATVKCKTNADCWKLLKQGGKSMQDLKKVAAEKAKVARVNPRSIVEWKALKEGQLHKIRKLGSNAEPLPGGEGEDVPEENKTKGGRGGTAEKAKASPVAKGKKRVAIVHESETEEAVESEEEEEEEEEEDVSVDLAESDEQSEEDDNDKVDEPGQEEAEEAVEEELGESLRKRVRAFEGGEEEKAISGVSDVGAEEEVLQYQITGSRMIGKQILKDFDGTLYLGEVVAWVPAVDGETSVFHVIYSDGDSEDIEEDELRECARLLKSGHKAKKTEQSALQARVASWTNRHSRATRKKPKTSPRKTAACTEVKVSPVVKRQAACSEGGSPAKKAKTAGESLPRRTLQGLFGDLLALLKTVPDKAVKGDPGDAIGILQGKACAQGELNDLTSQMMELAKECKDTAWKFRGMRVGGETRAAWETRCELCNDTAEASRLLGELERALVMS